MEPAPESEKAPTQEGPPKAPPLITCEDLTEVVLGCSCMRPFHQEVMETVRPPVEEPVDVHPRRRRRERRPQPQRKGTGVFVFGLSPDGCVTIQGTAEEAAVLADKLNSAFASLMRTELVVAIEALNRPSHTSPMRPDEAKALKASIARMAKYDRQWVVPRTGGNRHGLSQVVVNHADLFTFSGSDAKERVIEMETQFHRVLHELVVPIQLEWQKRLDAALPTVRRA